MPPSQLSESPGGPRRRVMRFAAFKFRRFVISVGTASWPICTQKFHLIMSTHIPLGSVRFMQKNNYMSPPIGFFTSSRIDPYTPITVYAGAGLACCIDMLASTHSQYAITILDKISGCHPLTLGVLPSGYLYSTNRDLRIALQCS